MQRICFIIIIGFCGLVTNAQTTVYDTLYIGGEQLVFKKEINGEEAKLKINRRKKANDRWHTNWLILDMGTSGFTDNTDYTQVVSPNGFVRTGLNKEAFTLKNNKSTNVNIWLFMKKYNLVKQYVNLKFGLGVELNNYRYTKPIVFESQPSPYVAASTNLIGKNKLAADYLTIPLLLNFTHKPGGKSWVISFGGSIGYLYSSRNKRIENDKKIKTRGDLGLAKFKWSYQAELGFNRLRLYGSFSPTSMFKNGLSQMPYNVGIRYSNF
jgi:hypothetical protein